MDEVDLILAFPGGGKRPESANAVELLGVEGDLDVLHGIASPRRDSSYEGSAIGIVSGTVRRMASSFSGADAPSSCKEASMTQTGYKVVRQRNTTQSSAPSQSPASKQLQSDPSIADVHRLGTPSPKDCSQKTGTAGRLSENVQHCPAVAVGKWRRPVSSHGRTTPASSALRDGTTDDDDDDDDDLVALPPLNTQDLTPGARSEARASTRTTQDAQPSSVTASEKGRARLIPRLTTRQRGAVENTEKDCDASHVEHDRHEDKPKIRRLSQGRKGASTKQTSLDSGFPAGDSDLDEILNLSSSSHAGDSVGLLSGVSAACATSDAGNVRSCPPPTGHRSTSPCIRQGSRKGSTTEPLADREPSPCRPPSSPTSGTFFPHTIGRADGAARTSSHTSRACSAGQNFGVCNTTRQADASEANSAAATIQNATATAAEAAPISTPSAATRDTQLELLRAENHALHVDNQMLHRRLQTEIQTAQATIQRELLGKRAEWQSERDKYEIRQRMLEEELNRLRDHQTQESAKFEAALKTLKEQCLMLETEQEKKYSRRLSEALEKEKENYKAILHDKTKHYLQQLKEVERRHKKQLEEQRKFFEERAEAHKQQVSAQEELYTLMKNVESSAASIEDLTERLATQAAQGTSTLSAKMAEREAALKEIEQRLRSQQQQAAKQHSTLVTLATNFRNEQKATQDKLFEEKERVSNV